MSDRYKGALLSPTPPTVTLQSANGVYTLSQQLQYDGQAVWPTAVNNPITRSLRFRSSASAYLNRTPASSTNRKTWTWSGWVKRGTLGTDQVLFGAYDNSSASDATYTAIYLVSGNNISVGGWSTTYRVTSAVYRDPSAWYHIVVVLDTTQATANNRLKVYVNGSEVTAFSTTNNPSQNADLGINLTQQHSLGRINYLSGSGPFYFDGYLAEVNFIDGQALTPSSFGTTDAFGIWQPIPYTGTYGTNGFYLPFTDNSALTTSSNAGLGKDFSGNGNYWVTNNISITSGSTYDSMTDVPTNTNSSTANYAVLNPLNKGGGTVTDGNLQNNGSGWSSSMTTISFSATGNFYCEMTGVSVAGASQGVSVGILNPEYTLIGYADAIGNQPLGYGWYSYSGSTYHNSSGTTYNGGATYTTNDIIGIQLNNGTLTFYKNGVSQGTAYSGITGNYCFAVSCYGTDKIALNCGQRPFSYTPPTGFNRLCTYNLPEPSIPIGNKYFDATTYTGNGSTQSITNSGSMQPDFIWVKSRSSTGAHSLTDSVRGVNSQLFSNLTNAEGTQTDQVTAFNSNGFSLGANVAGSGSVNVNTVTYVGWQWQAGKGVTSSNTNGSITSTVSANTTAGFSIVTYTGNGSAGATVGHGLGVAPSMVIVKRRNGVASWITYHVSAGNGFLLLENTAAYSSASTYWTSAPTSTVINTLTTNSEVNGNTNTYVAYCFAQVAGYSAFGSYTGNGSTDGPFVFTGFRPRFVLLKCSSSADNWSINDSARDTYNAWQYRLYPDLSNAENAGGAGDFLSNGFKLRSSSQNTNGATYIYMAFAENPFKIARAR